MRWLWLAAVLAACGDEVIYRPLLIHVENVSANAAVLELDLYPGSAGVACEALTADNAKTLTPLSRQRWERASGSARKLELPPVDEPTATVVVYTEDASAKVIQLGCLDLRYEELEVPEISLRLR